MKDLPKLTVEQIARPLLAIIMILCYWACDPQDADAATANVDRDGVVRVYDYPATEKAAFSACVTKQREMRDIPGSEAEYRVWWSQNLGTERQLDWSEAYDRCTAQRYARFGKWNFENMTLVRVEQP